MEENKMILNKNGKWWIRLIWLSIGTTGIALVNMVRKFRAPYYSHWPNEKLRTLFGK